MECILVGDCSTDSSREVMWRYRGHDKVSHIVCNDSNSGSTFAQWKRGIGLARGKYVWIAESDDSADAGFLSVLVPLLEAHQKAVVAYCGSHIIDASGSVIQGADWDRIGQKATREELLDPPTVRRRHQLVHTGHLKPSNAGLRWKTATAVESSLEVSLCLA